MKRIEIILNGRKILDIQSDETDYGSEYIALEVSQETKNNITQALRLGILRKKKIRTVN